MEKQEPTKDDNGGVRGGFKVMNADGSLVIGSVYDYDIFDDDYRMVLSSSLRDYCTDEVHQKYFLDFEGKALSLPCKFLPSRALLEQHRMRLVK